MRRAGLGWLVVCSALTACGGQVSDESAETASDPAGVVTEALSADCNPWTLVATAPMECTFFPDCLDGCICGWSKIHYSRRCSVVHTDSYATDGNSYRFSAWIEDDSCARHSSNNGDSYSGTYQSANCYNAFPNGWASAHVTFQNGSPPGGRSGFSYLDAQAALPSCGGIRPGSFGPSSEWWSCSLDDSYTIGSYRLTLQYDGNLVLYRGTHAMWSSRTNGKPVSYLAMQSDGNLVLYDRNDHAVCSTRTYNHPGAFLAVQDDGNLVIYYQGNAIWNIKQGGQCT